MRLMILAAAAAIIIGGCSGATSSNVTTSTAPVDPDGTTASTSTTLGTGAIPIAMAAIEAWNTSVAAFQGQFALDGIYDGLPVTDASVVNDIDFYIGLGDVVTVHSCETTAMDADVVDCLVTGRDAVSGVVGDTFEGSALMRIANGQVVAFGWHMSGGGKLGYNDEMVNWVREHHPIVFEESFADPTCTAARYDCYGEWAASGAAAAALRELHDEYLSSSSDN